MVMGPLKGLKTRGGGKLRRLTRSQNNRMLAGVCGGIAEYFGIDATVVRLLWTMLSLLTIWPGIVAYILAWIIVPADTRY